LDELIKQRNIINYVKSQRLSWFGHENRMRESNIVKKIYRWKPLTSRQVGRPKSRWEDDVRNGLKKTKLIKWTENKSKIASNGKLLLREPRFYQSCSTEEEEEEEEEFMKSDNLGVGQTAGYINGSPSTEARLYREYSP